MLRLKAHFLVDELKLSTVAIQTRLTILRIRIFFTGPRGLSIISPVEFTLHPLKNCVIIRNRPVKWNNKVQAKVS